MSRKRKIVYALLLVVVVITTLRETGVFDFHLNRATTEGEITSNWNDQEFTVELHDSIYKNGIDSSHSCYSTMQEVTVEVFCDDVHLGDTTSCKHVSVFIDNINYGFLSSPFYKHADFSCTVLCNTTMSFYQFKDSTVVQRQKTISGSVNIRGTFASWGLLSTRGARHTIREYIANEAYRIVQDHVRNSQ